MNLGERIYSLDGLLLKTWESDSKNGSDSSNSEMRGQGGDNRLSLGYLEYQHAFLSIASLCCEPCP